MLSKGIPQARHELQAVTSFLQVCNRVRNHFVAGRPSSCCASEVGSYAQVCGLSHVLIGPFPLAAIPSQPFRPVSGAAHLRSSLQFFRFILGLSPFILPFDTLCYSLRYM